MLYTNIAFLPYVHFTEYTWQKICKILLNSTGYKYWQLQVGHSYARTQNSMKHLPYKKYYPLITVHLQSYSIYY